MEHVIEVHNLKTQIEELTNLRRVAHEWQGLSIVVGIESMVANLGGYKQPPSTNLETIWVDCSMIIQSNQMLEYNHMSMITTTLVYAMRKRVLIDKLGNFRDL